MARNLIWPLGSTHVFIQSGWLILFNPDHLSRQHKLGKASKHFFSLVQDRHNDCPLSWIAAVAPPWGKPSNLWTPWVYSLRPRVPSWIWIRWIQYATRRNNFKSPSALAMSTAMKIPLWQPATSSLNNIFWRHSRFSRNNQNHKLMGDYIIPVLNQQTRLLLHLWRHISLTNSTMP